VRARHWRAARLRAALWCDFGDFCARLAQRLTPAAYRRNWHCKRAIELEAQPFELASVCGFGLALASPPHDSIWPQAQKSHSRAPASWLILPPSCAAAHPARLAARQPHRHTDTQMEFLIKHNPQRLASANLAAGLFSPPLARCRLHCVMLPLLRVPAYLLQIVQPNAASNSTNTIEQRKEALSVLCMLRGNNWLS